ncbi:dioxygenase family protein [Dongia deserti]|uniref:dioxygenase family protein n=1 Tax=Dongia deserti TaxID=2268030 RepID=UPI000E647155|nr:intradiol ring-cleavage dioxygenase [Dongia deserti]
MSYVRWSRRALLGIGASSILAGLAWRRPQAQQNLLPATPQCPDSDDPTPPQTEGPYFTPNSPERTNLVDEGMKGDRISLAGFVLDRRCRPVPGALLDLWHCDSTGAYDNVGYRLRGHQFSDAHGRFVFETIVPGLYPGRTRHFHIKVQAPGQRILTTQLYFPGEPGNARDWIFDSALLLDLTGEQDTKLGRYDFVLDLA